MDNDVIIRIAAGITLIGSVLVAFGIWTLTHYSGKKNSTQHLETQTGLQKVDSSITKGIEGIDKEFQNTIQEIQNQKKILSTKIEKETNLVIDELKLKSDDANKALEGLKKQSDEASKDISKLSFPLPNKLIPSQLTIVVNSDGIKKFLPELRKLAPKVDESMIEKYGIENIDPTVGLGYGFVSDEVMNVFDGKIITINVNILDNSVIKKMKRKFMWYFDVKVSLKNKEGSFLSFEQKYAKGTEDLVLQLYQINNSELRNNIKSFGGISSALELCDKKVWISISLDGRGVEIPIYSLSRLSFKDNNSKDYEILITGTEVRQFEVPSVGNKPAQTFDSTYMTGIINCLSF